ncbi:hypothetical protein DFQ28_000396 [Apophysomyces sp. BC1034]|nr:hypothetical protein DFQ30_008365 [Apophysomyces sp. BC1015]KAG0191333.1 hypothetical protein DFQ28_000396 [Apophysomyces sp. BC1034]
MATPLFSSSRQGPTHFRQTQQRGTHRHRDRPQKPSNLCSDVGPVSPTEAKRPKQVDEEGEGEDGGEDGGEGEAEEKLEKDMSAFITSIPPGMDSDYVGQAAEQLRRAKETMNAIFSKKIHDLVQKHEVSDECYQELIDLLREGLEAGVSSLSLLEREEIKTESKQPTEDEYRPFDDFIDWVKDRLFVASSMQHETEPSSEDDRPSKKRKNR